MEIFFYRDQNKNNIYRINQLNYIGKINIYVETVKLHYQLLNNLTNLTQLFKILRCSSIENV